MRTTGGDKPHKPLPTSPAALGAAAPERGQVRFWPAGVEQAGIACAASHWNPPARL